MAPAEDKASVFLSIDDEKPSEEGGPVARGGFTYQDEIAVGFFIEMLEDTSLIKMHCETHDDIVLVREPDDGNGRTAEYVQVKSNEPDKLLSIADLCKLKNGTAGTSIFEISFFRDKCLETSSFRIVTLRDVVKDLKVLTYPRENSDRAPEAESFKSLLKELNKRFPNIISKKGNSAKFWVEQCLWECSESLEATRNNNLIRMLKLGASEKRPLLPEQANVLLENLRSWLRSAGDAKWTPDRKKKIISNYQARDWWEKYAQELIDNRFKKSGGLLSEKLGAAGLTEDIIDMAVELRRDYSSAMRTRTYMQPEEAQSLQGKVKSGLLSLRAKHISGELGLNSIEFHSHCLDYMNEVNSQRTPNTEDRSAFLKGCMYDITDRCLLRFEVHEK